MRFVGQSFALPNLFLLFGAAVSILVAGTEDAWAIVAFLGAAGLAMLFVRPTARPSAVPLVLSALFCCLVLLSFLPQEYFAVPEWRRALADLGAVPLADSVNPQPWLGWFWWWLLAASCLVGAALLTAPLETKSLALVLHAAALFVAAYAGLAMFALQTGWEYPFHGGAVFGFLPNRNHTATLLVVGSVLSFGLMQWRLARGDRAAAGFAALCGAPSLAALLFFSTSRAGVVFLVIGLFIWALGASRVPAVRRQILVAVVILAVFAGLLFALGGSTVRDRLVQLWGDAMSVEAEGGEQDVDFRQPIFRDTMRMVADAPWTGCGIGQFRYVFAQYRNDSARAADVLHPESDWLMVAAESGVLSALVLAALAAWFVAVCWRARESSGGMLRWTAASAVLAAILHGAIDVPWHRVSLGWFLLTIAVSTVPSSASRSLRAPRLTRLIFFLVGAALLGAAAWIGRERSEGRSPLPYRWPEISKQLKHLGEERRYEEAEAAAQAAVRQFPLRYESHYWHAAHLRAFEESKPDVDAALASALAVEPVLAKVPAEHAAILLPVDPDGAMCAWRNAIERSANIDKREGRADLASAGDYIRRALAAFDKDKDRQVALGRELMENPILLGHWIAQAQPEAAAVVSREIMDVGEFLGALSTTQRQQVVSRWIASADAPRVIAFIEGTGGLSAGGQYWRQVAGYYAKAGDKPRAVGIVAEAEGIALDGSIPQGGFGRQLAQLKAQGNDVAVRRLAQEAVEARNPDLEKLRVALATYVAAGDWEMAWKAASRLATESKNRQ